MDGRHTRTSCGLILPIDLLLKATPSPYQQTPPYTYITCGIYCREKSYPPPYQQYTYYPRHEREKSYPSPYHQTQRYTYYLRHELTWDPLPLSPFHQETTSRTGSKSSPPPPSLSSLPSPPGCRLLIFAEPGASHREGHENAAGP